MPTLIFMNDFLVNAYVTFYPRVILYEYERGLDMITFRIDYYR